MRWDWTDRRKYFRIGGLQIWASILQSAAMGGEFREWGVRVGGIFTLMFGVNNQGRFGVLYLCKRLLWLRPIHYKHDAA